MKYIVYLTKNLINHKIYIGVHETEDPDVWDFYLGEGSYANKPSSYNKGKYPFHAALLKYGPSNFRRITLKVFDTLKEALWLESILVDEKFIRRKDTYNVALGGGLPPSPAKKVYQYDLNGVFITEFKSMEIASEQTNSYLEGIRNAIKLKRTCNNFYWSFEKLDSLNVAEYKLTEYKTKITAYNDDLIPIGEFESIADAGRFFEFDPKAISNAIYGKYKCYGITFVPNTMSIDELIELKNNFIKVAKTQVSRYDKETGEYIATYESLKDASKAVGLKTIAPIIRAIKTRKTSANCLWSYFKVKNILNESVATESLKPKQIGQYNENDELIKVWDINECRKTYPNCIRVCRGARNKAYGYKWKYIQ